tara:strand:+ start:71 stop:280 length:210 start_codon:yes stop_codon:yes gene_type:complete
MADYNNKGSLWKRQSRDNDEPGKKYPQYTGSFTDANGTVKNVAMWINTNKEKETQPDISFSVSDRLEKK